MNTAHTNSAVAQQYPPSTGTKSAQAVQLYAVTGRLRLAYRSRPLYSKQLRWFSQGIAREIQFIPALLGRHAIEQHQQFAVAPSVEEIRWLGRSAATAEVNLEKIYNLLPLGPEQRTLDYTEKRVGNLWWEECQIMHGDIAPVIYDLYERWLTNRLLKDQPYDMDLSAVEASVATLKRITPVMRQEMRGLLADSESLLHAECVNRQRTAADLNEVLSALYRP
ncbi:hypothetical protein FA95DRAFT_1557867 [Auriscalpium vulgare]|uniref:Uncharacterized protein n=1 Tax=Auriscalpium vulgare TaxID=40419 RepID=A0ACB8RXG0_9AGAM|nr:hypothetical protein FA95DRAFT_1557867 [Auriscalpium vulgare]